MKRVAEKSEGGWRALLRTIIVAGAIAFTFRSFAFEPFNIPSGSMLPTLLVGDFLFVSKYSYGYSKYSLPWSLPLIPDRILYTPPERGDVVVFRNPKEPSKDYIKRIVGLPGDTVQMRQGRLYINGQIVKRERDAVVTHIDRHNRPIRLTRHIETLPNGVSHYIYEYSDVGEMDDTALFTVPEDHFFAMGDNRDYSADSRSTRAVGYIPKKNLVGRAEMMFFSIDTAGDNSGIYGIPDGIRWDRIFMSIR